MKFAAKVEKTVLNSTLRKPISNCILGQNHGQILIEYILLLVVIVATTTVITQQLVGRGDNPGLITAKWISLNAMIADDPSD